MDLYVRKISSPSYIWPKWLVQQSHGLFATAKPLVNIAHARTLWWSLVELRLVTSVWMNKMQKPSDGWVKTHNEVLWADVFYVWKNCMELFIVNSSVFHLSITRLISPMFARKARCRKCRQANVTKSTFTLLPPYLIFTFYLTPKTPR